MKERDLHIHRHLSRAVGDLDIDVERRLSELRSGRRPPPPRGSRFVTIAFALLVAVVGIAVAARAFLRPSATPAGGGTAPQAILFTRWALTPEEPGFPNPRIWSVGIDGGYPGPLSQPPGNNQSAVWSPDGRRIAFVNSGAAGQPPTLWVMNDDGGDLTRLVEGFGVEDPAWSPSGTEIAFAGVKNPDSDTPGPTGIWIVPASGGEPDLLLAGRYSEPAWSPDGSRLVLVGPGTDDATNLYVVGSDGSSLAQLTSDGAAYRDPRWSPYGTKIAFARNAHPFEWNWDIYVMNPDGSDLRQLTDWKGWDSDPTWSPDGRLIVFTSDRDASPGELSIDERGGVGERGLAVYVMNADGTDQHLVFSDGAMQSVPTSWRGSPGPERTSGGPDPPADDRGPG